MLLKFIQALYDPTSDFLFHTNDYKNILKEIQMFGVSSQIYFLLKEKGKIEATPMHFQVQLKQNYQQTLYLNLFIKKQQEDVLKKLNHAEIEVIPLKGTVFVERFFGHIGARGTSDIDLLIHPKQLGKVVNCIRDLGFKLEEDQIEDHFHCSYSKNIPGSKIPLTIELHWDILKEKSSCFNIADFWNCSKVMNGYTHVRELSDFHTFYLMCIHGWRHNLDSPKYFIDIIQMIHKLKEYLDFSDLYKAAASHKTLKRLIRTLSIVYQQFPHLNKIQGLPLKRTHLHWDYQAFIYKDKRSIKKYIDFLDYQVLSYDSPVHLIKEIFKK